MCLPPELGTSVQWKDEFPSSPRPGPGPQRPGNRAPLTTSVRAGPEDPRAPRTDKAPVSRVRPGSLGCVCCLQKEETTACSPWLKPPWPFGKFWRIYAPLWQPRQPFIKAPLPWQWAERGHLPPYPSIGVLGRFIVVPEAQARDALCSVEADRDHVVQPRREGDQPHMLILHRDVGSID